MKIYIDGNYYDPEQAKISVFDHGFLYGDGVFEGIRIYHGRIFKLTEHVRRFLDSAKALELKLRLDAGGLAQTLQEAVKINQKENGYIRLIASRGDGRLGIDPSSCPQTKIVIIVGDIQLYPQELYTQGMSVVVSSYHRIPADCFDVRIKSLNYLNNILAKMEAQRQGCPEAIMLNREGYVLECTGDNIFIVCQGQLLTPPTYQGALEGITRAAVMDIASGLGLVVEEKPMTRYDLYTADECFLTGTAAEIIPISRIDAQSIGKKIPGDITRKLLSGFKDLVAAV